MSRLTGWWSGRDSAAKVELYTRWSFHFFMVIEIAAIGLIPIADAGYNPLSTPLGLALTLLVCVHAVLNAVLSSAPWTGPWTGATGPSGSRPR